jgi:P-type conjugative transfer protein TrbG
MIRFALLTAAGAISLSACAGGAAAAPSTAAFLAARLLTDAPAQTKPASKPLRLATPAKDPRPAASAIVASPSFPVTEQATRAALQEPSADAYVGATQVYPWAEGALYRLYTAPERVSDIALQPGESLISVAAGDTARWVIGDTTSGTGATERTHILVKPSAIGLKTNLVIATDRRLYHVELQSSAKAAMAGIAWSYPDDSLLALRGTAAAPESPVAADVAVETLDFNYRIEGDNPPWRPLRAFDDGRQVFIEFPPTLPEGEAPPLFVTGGGGRAELVNYRQHGRYYVVDRLFAAAELRLGERRQQVVRIVRQNAGPLRGRSGS